MADSLIRLFSVSPELWWLPVLAAAFCFGAWLAVFEPTEKARQLIADVRLALDRADCSIDLSSRCARISQPKLSDQLRGVSPFTAMSRLFTADQLADSEFEAEFLAIRAKRRGLALVRADVGDLIARLDDALGIRKSMAKAELIRRDEGRQAS